jgi:hypothetical protein
MTLRDLGVIIDRLEDLENDISDMQVVVSLAVVQTIRESRCARPSSGTTAIVGKSGQVLFPIDGGGLGK